MRVILASLKDKINQFSTPNKFRHLETFLQLDFSDGFTRSTRFTIEMAARSYSNIRRDYEDLFQCWVKWVELQKKSIEDMNGEDVEVTREKVDSLEPDLFLMRVEDKFKGFIEEHATIYHNMEYLELPFVTTQQQNPRISNLSSSQLKNVEAQRGDSQDWQGLLKELEKVRIATEKIAEASAGVVPSGGCSHKRHKINLKKMDPPTFSGNMLDFPEFKRRWNNIVHINEIPETQELEMLREVLESEARRAIHSSRSLENAWMKLERRYGDSTLIAQKLKKQLKNLRLDANIEHEQVIELHDKVEEIVHKLKDMKHEEVLKHDSEFIGAIYRLLPNHCKADWTMMDPADYDDKWTAFDIFLESAYLQATRARQEFNAMGDLEEVQAVFQVRVRDKEVDMKNLPKQESQLLCQKPHVRRALLPHPHSPLPPKSSRVSSRPWRRVNHVDRGQTDEYETRQQGPCNNNVDRNLNCDYASVFYPQYLSSDM